MTTASRAESAAYTVLPMDVEVGDLVESDGLTVRVDRVNNTSDEVAYITGHVVGGGSALVGEKLNSLIRADRRGRIPVVCGAANLGDTITGRDLTSNLDVTGIVRAVSVPPYGSGISSAVYIIDVGGRYVTVVA